MLFIEGVPLLDIIVGASSVDAAAVVTDFFLSSLFVDACCFADTGGSEVLTTAELVIGLDALVGCCNTCFLGI